MKRLYYIVATIFIATMIIACSKKEDPSINDPIPASEPAVQITKITIHKNLNPSLDRIFNFTPDEQGRFTGRIFTYSMMDGKSRRSPVDIRNMKVTFETDAEKLYWGDKAIVSGVTPIDLSHPATIKAVKGGQSREYVIDLSHFTGLPVVYINTDSGQKVASKEEYEGATLEIIGCGDINDTEFQKIQIHGRGNATWFTFPKKPSYTIKLETRQNILGMPKHKKWVLMANYRDKTLLRNNVAWRISSKLSGMKYTPRFQHAELILNGTHRGVYQFAEQVRIDKNRVNINEMLPTDTDAEAVSGGYIIELDRVQTPDQWEWIMPNMNGSARRLSIKLPKKKDMNQQQHDYIKAYVHKVDAMFGNPDKLEEVMTKYIDMPSWAAQWLVFEISGTPEPNGPSSWYTYKDKNDDKWYCGPPWDFDYKSFVPSTANQWISANAIYMPMMLKYPPFKQELLKQWNEIKGMLPQLIDYINEQRVYMQISAQTNWTMHEQNLIDDNRRENGDEFIPSNEAIDRMISYLKAKWEFIDKNIANL